MSLARLFVFVVGVTFVAVLAPKVAPDFVASFMLTSQSAPAQPSSPGRSRQTALYADPRGHFMVDTVIDGRSVAMMIDTGATIVALNGDTAHRLGINPAQSDYNLPLSTANGVILSARVTLGEITVGGVSVRNVEATVVPGNALPTNLLGMSFLNRLSRFEMAGGQLVLVE